jgi:ATP-dependent DNA ligase
VATAPAFEDVGSAVDTSVRELGWEGVVAKKLSSRYRPGELGWLKIKNPAYWRRDAEREAVARSADRRALPTGLR